MKYILKSVETELGELIAVATDRGISLLEFADSQQLNRKLQQLDVISKTPTAVDNNPCLDALERQHSRTMSRNLSCTSHLEALEKQLAEYFKGKRREFNIPLDLVGTEFQKKVWLSLLRIPYGHTISYAEQAKLIGKPTAVRAVANANGQNKLSIILPCHRVIGSGGTLTGYGGGVWRKEKLLELEKQNL